MKSLLHLFRRYRVASLLNFVGLVFALAGCYVLLTQINYPGSFNHGIKDYKHIYRVYICGHMEEGVWHSNLPRPFAEKLKECPQVENVGYLQVFDNVVFDKGGSSISAPRYLCNDGLLTMMGAELVDGSLTVRPHGDGAIYIPASLSEKYFGTSLSSGKQMKDVNGKTYTVGGVFKDFPVNSNMVATAVYMGMGTENWQNYSNYSYSLYVRVRGDLDEKSFNETLKSIYGDKLKELRGDDPEIREKLDGIKLAALSLADTYFNGYDPWIDRGNKTMFYILHLAVVLLLAVALINFANFSMAQAPMRLRGVNIRKVMGESALSLRLHLMGEGVAIALLALAGALLLICCASRWESIGQYTLGSLSIPDNPGVTFLVTGLAVMVGIIATFYSARYVTSFQPSLAMKGNFGLSPSGRLVRQSLVGIQLVLAFVMILFVSVIFCQTSYIYTSDYGYEKDALLFGEISYRLREQKSVLRSELEKIKGVESVSFSAIPLGLKDECMSWGRGSNNEYYYFSVIPVDWKMLRTCGIDIVEGRDFKEQDGDVYIINEAMKRKYPKVEVDKPLLDGDLTVVGVCKNFRAFTTRVDNDQTPLAFIVYGDAYSQWGDPCRTMYVRMAANTDKVQLRKKINSVLQTFVHDGPLPDMSFTDEKMEVAYWDEMRFMTQMEASMLLAFLVTIIGVFCLTMFETEYRHKEIAIRKVMGSSVAEVLALFTSRYALPLLVSFAIAAPIAYYVSEQWLQNFAEHTPIYWWLFPAAFVLMTAIVLVTVVVQSWRVATRNPMESIKTE